MHNLVGAAGNMHHLVSGGAGSAGSVNNLAALALPTGGAAVAGGGAAAPNAGAAGHGPLTSEEKRELIRQCVADLMRWPQFSPGRRKSAAELAAIRAAGGPTEAPDFKKVRAYLRSDDFKVYNQNLVEFLDDILAGEWGSAERAGMRVKSAARGNGTSMGAGLLVGCERLGCCDHGGPCVWRCCVRARAPPGARGAASAAVNGWNAADGRGMLRMVGEFRDAPACCPLAAPLC
jgi:hypothetical protein